MVTAPPVIFHVSNRASTQNGLGLFLLLSPSFENRTRRQECGSDTGDLTIRALLSKLNEGQKKFSKFPMIEFDHDGWFVGFLCCLFGDEVCNQNGCLDCLS